jgi:DNA-binding NtrC family response regulator
MPNEPSVTLSTHPATESIEDAGQSHPSALLKVVASPDPELIGAQVALTRGIVALGREVEQGGLRLEDPRMSRVHARITYDVRAPGYRIGDAQSHNGTFVNGRRIETVVLSSGDVIRVGDTLLVYGGADPMVRVREQAATAAPLNVPVLLRGEIGTGKEILARAIHAQSGRPGAFTAINCASISGENFAAELFGHTEGAFVGATGARKGILGTADGGTLFLDEVVPCPPPVQAALLRALQENAIRPVGAERQVPVDIRVIAATHADVEAAIGAGSFRADLYARLAQVTLKLPPLRERRTEIIEFSNELAEKVGISLRLRADAAEVLLCWDWPFNIRELEAVVVTCFTRSRSNSIGLKQLVDAFPDMVRPILEGRGTQGDAAVGLPEGIERASDPRRLRALLEQHDGNVAAVARTIGKPRAQVYRWLRAMGVSAGRFRK